MTIDLTTLPLDIQNQIPLSIRTHKNVYKIEELPSRIQEIIESYLELTPNVIYKSVFDFTSQISRYSDFATINNKIDLIIEYLRNYFVILPGSYPFDPVFGCNLKYHLQTRDTSLRQTLLSAEIDKVIDVLSAHFRIPIVIENVSINPLVSTTHTEYFVKIDLKISDYHRTINLQFS